MNPRVEGINRLSLALNAQGFPHVQTWHLPERPNFTTYLAHGVFGIEAQPRQKRYEYQGLIEWRGKERRTGRLRYLTARFRSKSKSPVPLCLQMLEWMLEQKYFALMQSERRRMMNLLVELRMGLS